MTVLEILDEQLLAPGKIIYKKRTAFLKQLIPLGAEILSQIADNAETISLQYTSQLNESSFEELLKQYRQKDLVIAKKQCRYS